MKSVKVTLSMPEYLEKKATLRSRAQNIHRTEVIFQWLVKAVAPDILADVNRGDISIGYAAEALRMTHHDLLDLAETLGIPLGPTAEQFRRSLETVEEIASQNVEQRKEGHGRQPPAATGD